MQYEPWWGRVSQEWMWFRRDHLNPLPWDLPPEVFAMLQGHPHGWVTMCYPTRQHALQALSIALWRLEAK